MQSTGSWIIDDPAPLGRLWLPWYVERAQPSEPIRDLSRGPDVRQLRVRDTVEDAEVRQALSVGTIGGGLETHEAKIDAIAQGNWATPTAHPGFGPVPALTTPQGPVLMDGCHRACAIYRIRPPRGFIITLERETPYPGHPDAAAGPRS